MRRSKSYEVRDTMNIWNKYDFAMSGLGKKSKILAKIKHFFKCVKWSKQRITRGYSLIKNPPLKLSLNIILREDSCNVIELVVQKLCCI